MSSTDDLSPLSITTLYSLLAVLALLSIAFFAATRLIPLPTSSSGSIGRQSRPGISLLHTQRQLLVWHLFDCLIHFVFEGSFIYHCFFTFTTIPKEYSPTYTPADSLYNAPQSSVHFLGHADRSYGSAYGTSATAKLWQEYARADRRWGGADLTIVSLELLTVFGAGTLAAFICYEIVRVSNASPHERVRLWFWVIILATGEIYGGFMTFAPEWLSGSTNLNTDNFLFFWVYLMFFNLLWVVIPLWALYQAYVGLTQGLLLKSSPKQALTKQP